MRKGPPAAAAFSTREQALDAVVREVFRQCDFRPPYPDDFYFMPSQIRREFARLTEEMGQ